MRTIAMVLLLAMTGCTTPPESSTPPGPLVVPDYVTPEPVKLKATTIREYPAPEADQGAAVDAHHFYANRQHRDSEIQPHQRRAS